MSDTDEECQTCGKRGRLLCGDSFHKPMTSKPPAGPGEFEALMAKLDKIHESECADGFCQVVGLLSSVRLGGYSSGVGGDATEHHLSTGVPVAAPGLGHSHRPPARAFCCLLRLERSPQRPSAVSGATTQQDFARLANWIAIEYMEFQAWLEQRLSELASGGK